MANTIRIKRRAASGSSGAPTTLKNGEIAFNENDKTLYYGLGDDGSGNANSIPAIGGLGGASGTRSTYLEGAYVTLDTAQSVSGNKTLSGTTNASGTLNVSGTFQLSGSAVTSNAAELNLLDNVSGLVKADFTKLAAVDSTAAELNKLNGVTTSTTELNYVDGVTSGIQDQIDAKQDTVTFGIADDNAVEIDDTDAAVDDFAVFTANGLKGLDSSEVVSTLGAVTTVGAGSLIDIDVSGATSTVNVDLSELDDMTAAIVAADEFVVLDASSQKRKAASEIPLSIFNNDLTDSNTTYDLTVPASTTAIRLAGSDSTNDDITITGGSNVSVTRTSATELSIASSFTNTTYSSESNGGLVLNGTEFRLDADNMAVHTGTSTLDAFTIHPGGSGGYEKPKSRQIDTFPISAFKTDVATSITGVGTIATGTWEATDIAVAHGGTGASTAANARTNLGLGTANTPTFGGITVGGKANLNADVDVAGDLDCTTGDLIISTGNLIGPSTFYIDPSPHDSPHNNNSPAATGLVVIRGDLQVDGTTTTINSTEITIEDSTFTVAGGTTGLANLDETGIHFGANDEIKFDYDHTNTTMVLNQALKITGDLDGAIIDGGVF